MSKYFSFKGLAKRQEYWAVIVIITAIMFAIGFFSQGLMISGSTGMYLGSAVMIGSLIASIWVQFAVAARRCRDAAISPWWVLLLIIPYVNFVVTIVFGVLRSNTAEVDNV